MCKRDNTVVKDGRLTKQGNYRRVRECLDCGYRYKTIEYYVENPIRGNYYNDKKGRLRSYESAD